MCVDGTLGFPKFGLALAEGVTKFMAINFMPLQIALYVWNRIIGTSKDDDCIAGKFRGLKFSRLRKLIFALNENFRVKIFEVHISVELL